MRSSPVIYRVKMDQKTFRAFALYDAFIQKKHAKLPIVFLCIMTAFAIVAFLSDHAQRWLIVCVLFGIGLGMPAVYLGTFLYQVKKKGHSLSLEKPRPVYTVTLSRDEITVHNDIKHEDDVHLQWDTMYRVIRRKDCFYLYAVPEKAFILPDKDANCSAKEAAAFIQNRLPGDHQKQGR